MASVFSALAKVTSIPSSEMISKCVLLVAFAVFGASAKPMLNSGFQSNGFSLLGGSYGSTLPVMSTQVRTPVVDNTVRFQTFVPQTVTDSCQCLKTLIRPQIRNDIITVPTVDQLVRTVSSPVVETVNYGTNRRLDLPAFTQTNGVLSLTGDKTLSGVFQGQQLALGNVATAGGLNGGITGTTFNTCQGHNAGAFNGASITGLHGAATANALNVATLQSATPTVFPTSTNGLFSTNSVFSNGPRIGTF